MQEQGIPETYIVNGRPGNDNKAEADVVAQAKEAVIAKYNLKPEVLNKFKVQIAFNIIDPDNPMWQIEFRVKDGKDIMDLGYYRVDIDDRTGEVVHLYSIADAEG